MPAAQHNPFTPTDRMLRQFSGLWVVFFTALAASQLFLHGRQGLAIGLASLAITLGPLGLVWPRAIRPIFIAWMALAYPIGWTVSRVILGILFYGLFTPFALTFRMIGRDVLGLKSQPKASTYWRRKPAAPDSSQYLRQY